MLISRLTSVLGEPKVIELKKLRESGTPITEIAEKTKQWISELTDEKIKELTRDYTEICTKAFNIQ